MTAQQWLRQVGEADLAFVLRRYGEEPRARRIAPGDSQGSRAGADNHHPDSWRRSWRKLPDTEAGGSIRRHAFSRQSASTSTVNSRPSSPPLSNACFCLPAEGGCASSAFIRWRIGWSSGSSPGKSGAILSMPDCRISRRRHGPRYASSVGWSGRGQVKSKPIRAQGARGCGSPNDWERRHDRPKTAARGPGVFAPRRSRPAASG